jgi:HEAT repeat protein
LIANLSDDNPDARQEAAKALGHIGPAAVPALTAALQDPNETIRQEAAKVLKQIEMKK